MKRILALDGVRALAVSAVILYHLEIRELPGGFIGVDVFFVLSGFLITTMLVTELNAAQRIDLVRFWLGRARRLLPALFVVLAVVMVYTGTRPPDQQLPLRKDLLSSFFYVANWQFIAEGRSYFGEVQAPSPLRHMWSLAVEEQFYLVFPIALIIFARMWRRFRRGNLLFIVAVVAGAAASVAALAIFYIEADPSRAYYATDTRAHELLAGVGLALLLRTTMYAKAAVAYVNAKVAELCAGGGLATLLVLFATVDDRAPFYYRGGSVVASLASMALIWGVTVSSDSGTVARLLSIGAVAYVGRISYGLYLWHWPAIVILSPERIGISGVPLPVVQVGAALAASAASYHFLEKPIRYGKVATPTRVVTASLGAALILPTVMVGTTWNAKPEPEYVRQNGGLMIPKDADPRAPVIGLVGDSIAASLQRALADAAGSRGHVLISAARPGCAVGSSLLLDESGHPFASAQRCAEQTPRLQDRLVADHRPKIVLWHSTRDRNDVRDAGRTLKAGTPEWVKHRFADWDAALARLARRGAHVMVLLPVWSSTGSAGSSCGGEFSFDPGKCGRTFVTTEHLRRLYSQWAHTHPREVSLIDLAVIACPSGSPPCPKTLAKVQLRDDGVHYSAAGARLLAPWILDSALAGDSAVPSPTPVRTAARVAAITHRSGPRGARIPPS